MFTKLIILFLSSFISFTNIFFSPRKNVNHLGDANSFDREMLTGNHNYDYYNLIGLFDAQNISIGRKSVSVGVIDSGIFALHNYLYDNIDFSRGSYRNDYFTTAYSDSTGHGTHVAGIIGGTNNSSENAKGVCTEISLISYRRFYPDPDNPSSSMFNVYDVADTIEYASGEGVEILNISGGGSGYFSDVYNSINSFGGLIVCAAGNLSHNNDDIPFYPSSYTCSNIISVGWSDWSDNISIFSNYGQSSVDLFAPGEQINSTIPGANSYDYMSGTSMAAPFVTGTVALIKSVNPSLSNAEIKACILDNVDLVSSMSSKCVSGGRLNVYKAVKAAIPEIGIGSNSSIQDLSYGEHQFYKIDVDDEMTLRIISTGNLHLTGYLYSEPSLSAIPVATSHYYGSGNFELFYEVTDPGTYYLNVVNNNMYQGSYGIYTEEHSGHTYNSSYDYHNAFRHKSYCACGDYILDAHTFYAGVCVYCGGTSGGIIPLSFSFVNNPNYEKIYVDSYIVKSNGIIILGLEDFKKLKEEK